MLVFGCMSKTADDLSATEMYSIVTMTTLMGMHKLISDIKA